MNRNKTAKDLHVLSKRMALSAARQSFAFTFRLASRPLLFFGHRNESPDHRHGAAEHGHPHDGGGGQGQHEYSGKWRGEQETKALDFIAVSIATVLHVVSPYLNARMIQ